MHKPITISLDQQLLEIIDHEKGLVTRSTFIESKLKECFKQTLKEKDEQK
jgi:metal-responsive CopG/Arc/MetJ family transcriptional regulator